MDVLSLGASLAHASADAAAVVRVLGGRERVDLGPLPRGALALLVARAVEEHGRRVLLLVPDAETGQKLEADLRFFLDAAESEARPEVLLYPPADTTPFVDVAADQRAAMDRLSALFHLASEQPWKALVVPVTAAVRRVPPRAALVSRCRTLRVADIAPRQALLSLLIESGYLRTPVCEDAGTFAVRGGILDVYPPHADQPLRVELDDDLVASIKHFDPDTQRTLADAQALAIHPVRETLLGQEELQRARGKVNDLCDALNLPTMRRQQLVDDVASGRRFLGVDGYLPAFYEELESLFDYLPDDVRCVVVDPLATIAALRDELSLAERDRAAKVAVKAPVFTLDDLYLDERALLDAITARPLCVAHRLPMLGEAQEEEGDVPELSPRSAAALVRVSAEDQSALATELRTRRAAHQDHDPLEPLRRRLSNWLDHGLQVAVTARTQVQAERIASLLRSDVLPVGKPHDGARALLEGRPSGRVEMIVGSLEDGFVLPSQAFACVTEEEIFGTQKARRQLQKKKQKDKLKTFVQDLRELSVGDYVVHADHGVGVYRGLTLSELPVTRMEALQGMKPRRVEALVVEYAGGDRLFLPVTRLNQIDKVASKEGHSPKLDKLGGSTFARTKSRVRASVKQLADELLQLYALRAARERPPYAAPDRLYAELEARFPYEETADQARAIDDVMRDLEGGHPMDRLVCGDVGFGKTEVALRAAFRVALSGRQVAVLCPTTVLAQQHLITFRARLADYPLRVEMLSRFVDKKGQNEVVAGLKEGRVDVVIGTHRLLSSDVHFARLGLLVVDEEQRFGVTHKERIKKLRTEVDVLTLSATPIPRTMHMAIGGLRELSLIATPPLDRRAVRTFITRWDDHVIREAIKRELSRGGQVFFVHNRIDGLYERAARLQQLIPEARIAVAHGKLKDSTLEHIMTDFVEGRYDVLASTAIVENGLDIPRANTILIDRADIYGLGQLYQLRGRVGRSRERAYCYLIAPPPTQLSDEARARLEALERFSQLGAGFQVASLDLELRGAGDLLGEEQSGNVSAIGFDLFVHMLQEAIAELRGEPLESEVETELTLDLEHYIPDDYVQDVGLRLSFYKRLSSAPDEESVHELAAELEDRFGKPPTPVLQLVRVMAQKPGLRALHVVGCDASASRVTLHFAADAPIDGAKLAALVSKTRGYQLTPEGKLIARFEPQAGRDSIDHVEEVLRAVTAVRV